MKTKMASLLLLTLGWLPGPGWWYATMYLISSEQSVRLANLMSWLSIGILPGVGGLLAGWCWRWRGLLVSLLYLGSAVVATPLYLSWLSSLSLPPGRWFEGPTGALLLMLAVPGTGVALVASFLGLLARLVQDHRHKVSQAKVSGNVSG